MADTSEDRSSFGPAHEPMGCAADPVGYAWVQPAFLAAIREVLPRIAYKPGSSFELRDGGDLMLTTVEYDRTTGDRIPMIYNDEAFAARVMVLMAERGIPHEHAVFASFREAVLTEEHHESSEWISLDGTYHFDPHEPTGVGMDLLTRAANPEI